MWPIFDDRPEYVEPRRSPWLLRLKSQPWLGRLYLAKAHLAVMMWKDKPQAGSRKECVQESRGESRDTKNFSAEVTQNTI